VDVKCQLPVINSTNTFLLSDIHMCDTDFWKSRNIEAVYGIITENKTTQSSGLNYCGGNMSLHVFILTAIHHVDLK
jgi:hypothetical protein